VTAAEAAGPAPDDPVAHDPVRDEEVTLPEVVRARVVSLAAEALTHLEAAEVPASLRRVAAFAPHRRARLAASQLAGVLAADHSFLEAVGRRVRQELPELADALDKGQAPAAAEPVDVAALAYLLRPAGWAALLHESAEVAETERAGAQQRRAQGDVERLEAQVAKATDDLRDAQRRHREQLAEVKSENTELRHRLGDVRARLRTAEAALERARAEVERAESDVAAERSSAAAENRRLRQQLEQVERELSAVRRTDRGGRDLATMRARLLLDTVVDAAQGLRRELSLPTTEGAPADQVAAHVADVGTVVSSSHGSMSDDDPQRLDQLLALPRVHLVVDGYNVTKTGWPELPLDRQRDRLLAGLAPLASRSGAELTVVFDAADLADRPPVSRTRGVRVLFSPPGVIADDVIRELVEAEPPGRPVVVVSSDQEVVRDVTAHGARAAGAEALVRLLSRG
jgi:predicted RNA-binding protein with PIN domain